MEVTQLKSPDLLLITVCKNLRLQSQHIQPSYERLNSSSFITVCRYNSQLLNLQQLCPLHTFANSKHQERIHLFKLYFADSVT